jgi:hypothetical protein
MHGTPSTVYAVDLAADRITVVRHRRRGGGRPAAEVLLEGVAGDDPAWVNLRSRLTAEQAAGRASVAAALPAADGFLRALCAPFASVGKARSVFPALLDVELPFPLEQCVYQMAAVHRTADRAVQATAFAAPRDRVEALIAGYRAVGIDPDWIDPEAAALWRAALRAAPPVSDRPRVVLACRADRTVAVAGDRNGPAAVIGARVGWSGGALSGADTARLLGRLRPFLAGVQRAGSTAAPEVLVVGEGATRADAVRDELGIDPACWRVVDATDGWTVHAVAEGPVGPGPWSVNLRAGALTHPAAIRRAAGATRRSLAALAAAAVVLIGVAVAGAHHAAARHDAAQAGLQRAVRALTGMPFVPRGQELLVAERFVVETEAAQQAFHDWLAPDALPRLAEALDAAAAHDLRIETLTVRADSLVVRGSGPDWDRPQELGRPLVAAGWQVEIERKDAGADERIPFVVRAAP